MAFQVLTSSTGVGVQKTLAGSANGLVLGGASIVSTENAAIALTGTGQSLAIHGTVFGQSGINYGTAVTTPTGGRLVIGATGQVGALDAAVTFKGSNVGLGVGSQVLNSGRIESLGDVGLRFEGSVGISETGGVTLGAVRNYGTISGELGGIQAIETRLFVANYGTISGLAFGLRLGTQDDLVINRGTIEGLTALGLGNNTLRNYDFMAGGIEAGEGDDAVGNYGNIDGAISLGAGDNQLRNDGTVNGDVTGLDGGDRLTNLGKINGNVDLGFGNYRINNRGSISGDVINQLGSSTFNQLDNRNGVIEGGVFLGDGIDSILNKGGLIGGQIRLGAGKDIFDNRGGIVKEFVDLGGGDDRWTAGDEDEFVSGGTGRDTLDLASKGAVDLNLSEEIVTSGALLGSRFSNFEDVIGSRSSPNVLIGNSTNNSLIGGTKVDFIRGGSGRDSIQGGADDDTLDGGKDDDILYGGAGDDALFGDLGVDLYYGQAGADRFALGGMYAVDGKVDRILDFSAAQKDRIDLFDIDANSVLAGNQKFSFIGTGAFTSKAGELRYMSTSTADVYRVLGDTNGDGIANFIVEVTVAGSTGFVEADFIL